MAMNTFCIVECFQIFEDQSVRMIIITDFEAVQPFTEVLLEYIIVSIDTIILF